ncbi:hypothetical protein [Croceicoccus hydrothermalis]|uniref:hypothetical protein n=1 Tax=Croceicoccus hydrothermalis TaxID=2867964 RepID=UPI001EFBC287|nr:hypothetical protein [Croceicoccus hydrothermalis]
MERERAALEQAQKEVEERRKRLAELEEEEQQKALEKLVKKVGRPNAIEILELSAAMKPKVAIDLLKQPKGSAALA